MNYTIRYCGLHLSNNDITKCPFKYKKSECLKTQKFYIDINNEEHSDLTFNINNEKCFGIHPFYRNEILRIFKENGRLGPLDIYKILIKNKLTYDKDNPFLTRQQVRDFKYNTKKQEYVTNELGTVVDYLNKYKFND